MPAFADTNVVVYAFAKDDAKIAIAEGILEKQPTISVQVISEFLNVCRIKLGMDVATRHKLAAKKWGRVHISYINVDIHINAPT